MPSAAIKAHFMNEQLWAVWGIVTAIITLSPAVDASLAVSAAVTAVLGVDPAVTASIVLHGDEV